MQRPHARVHQSRRAHARFLLGRHAPTSDSRIYATEQSSPLFIYLQKRFPFLQGSEFVQDAALMTENKFKKLRHEDLTQLSFATQSFDAILSFDVLEHIPDYRSAFAECARTLKPAGKMLFSVPFDATSAHNHIRAQLRKDGTIEHLLAPEHHDDPRNPEGCLCFQHFGWEMFEEIKQAGFSRVSALSYYSQEYGYLGDKQIQFPAEKYSHFHGGYPKAARTKALIPPPVRSKIAEVRAVGTMHSPRFAKLLLTGVFAKLIK